jgi:hypothetical protein
VGIKGKDYLTNLTPEQRLEIQEKAKASRLAKIEAGKDVIQDYDELNLWRDLASQAGMRLPATYYPSSATKYVRKALKKVGITPKEWCEIGGYSTLDGFGKDNPKDSIVLEVGLILEHWDEDRNSP